MLSKKFPFPIVKDGLLLVCLVNYLCCYKALQRAVSGKVTFADEALFLLHFTEKSAMLYEFDEELFEKTISRISVYSRHEIAFELKCGLILKERI